MVTDVVTEVAKHILSPVTDGIADTWAAVIGDRLAGWRLTNAMRTRERVLSEASRLGLRLNLERIPTRFALTWLEAASKQDDDTLQTMFARLLPRCGSDGAEETADERLIKVLSELSPPDASLFQRLYSERPFPADFGPYAEFRGFLEETDGYPRYWLQSILKHINFQNVDLSLDNLNRAGCVQINSGMRPKPNGVRPSVLSLKDADWRDVIAKTVEVIDFVKPTDLGRALYHAVKS